MLPVLREKLKHLNPTVLTDDARVNAIVTKLRGCRDNVQWLAWPKDGVNYKFDAAENAQDVRLIDYDDLDANDWWVTNQFPVEGRSPRRPDIGPLINGIPVVVIEAKTASRAKSDPARRGQTTEHVRRGDRSAFQHERLRCGRERDAG